MLGSYGLLSQAKLQVKPLGYYSEGIAPEGPIPTKEVNVNS